MKKYKVYLFDFDGTLFDTSKGLNYVFKEAFKVAGVKVEDKDIPYLSRVPLKESFDTLGGDYNKADEFVERIEEALDEEPAIKTTLKFPELKSFTCVSENPCTVEFMATRMKLPNGVANPNITASINVTTTIHP